MALRPIPASRTEEDQALIARVALGDAAALERLYALHAGRLLGTIIRLIGSRPDAEEVLQETFFELWMNATRYDAKRASVQAWLLTLARTRAIDRLRRGAVLDRVIASAAAQPVPQQARDRPQDALDQHQSDAQVRAALASLPPEQRAALEAAFMRGLSHREIARQTGLPLGTVKTRIRAAMLKLASLL